MLTYSVIPRQDGWHVAYYSPRGYMMSVGCWHSQQGAERDAAQRNARAQAEEARQQAAALAPRRSVRWFEPDAYA